MIKNLQQKYTSPQSLYNEMLSKKNINIDNIPKAIDNAVMKKNKKQTRRNIAIIGSIGAAISILLTEWKIQLYKKKVTNKKSINETVQKTLFKEQMRSYRRFQVITPIIIGTISVGAYLETQIKKKIGLISKEDIYRSQGFDIKERPAKDKYKITPAEYALMGVGASLSLLKSFSNDKFKIPLIESSIRNKPLNTIAAAILNGVAFGGIYTIGKAIFTKDKK